MRARHRGYTSEPNASAAPPARATPHARRTGWSAIRTFRALLKGVGWCAPSPRRRIVWCATIPLQYKPDAKLTPGCIAACDRDRCRFAQRDAVCSACCTVAVGSRARRDGGRRQQAVAPHAVVRTFDLTKWLCDLERQLAVCTGRMRVQYMICVQPMIPRVAATPGSAPGGR